MNVVFVVPYAMETTLRFVRATAGLGVRLGIISQEPGQRLATALGPSMSAFERVHDPLDADELTRAVRSIGRGWGGRVDRIIGVLEQLQVPLAEVRERLGIRGMDSEEAANFRDKARMKDRLRAHGLPCARHRLVGSAEEALAFARECLPLVVKPPAGAGARNTQRVDSLEELRGYLRALPPSPDSPLLLEEFILGREHSFDAVTVNGETVFHSISRYDPTPLEVMEHPWLQWCVLLPRRIDGDEFEDIRATAPRALTALGMVTGLTHMEWFRRPDGSLAISEVAARPPGAQFTTLLSYAHDLDFYAAWAELMVFERFQVPARSWSVGALFLRGQGQGRVRAVHGLQAAQDELGELVVESKLPRRNQAQADSYEGEGYVILRHPDTERVERGLVRLRELLRVELGEPETSWSPTGVG